MADSHNMSDEDFLAGGDEFFPDEEVAEDEGQEEEVESNLEDTDPEEDEAEVDDTTEQLDDDAQDTDETAEDEEDPESQTDDTEEEAEDKEDDTEEDTPETDDFDYKAFYEEVTGDYKANGRMQPGFKDPQDFKIALAKASDYAQKTTALKPHMRRIKMLQDVSDDELNEMMDFRSRDPELLKKALLEAKIDPIEIDMDAKSTYAPKDYSVSSEEVEFDEVLDSIRNTPTFAKTTEVVAKQWDEKSKQAMMASPTLIAALNEEMEMGRYDTIQGMIDQRRMLGKTGGQSDLEMYQEIATEMNQNSVEPEPAVDVVKPKVVAQNPAEVLDSKKKAGIVRTKTAKVKKNKYDPAKLSDEEFEALMAGGAEFKQG